jgi:hypothetical protein
MQLHHGIQGRMGNNMATGTTRSVHLYKLLLALHFQYKVTARAMEMHG